MFTGTWRFPLSDRGHQMKKSCQNLDRFIPNRSAMDFDFAQFMINGGKVKTEDSEPYSPSKAAYRRLLAEACNMNRPRILAFRDKPPPPKFQESSPPMRRSKPIKQIRRIPQSPERTLSAPDILDDFNVNLLDWGCHNVLAIALGNAVFLWDAANGSTTELVYFDEDEGPVTSVRWDPDGRLIAVGLHNSDIQLWDAQEGRLSRTLRGGHRLRVCSLDWINRVLTSGGMDSLILNNDVREPSHVVGTYRGHTAEVCGLKWSANGRQLASGGNDNLVYLWDLSRRGRDQWLHRFADHTAAVKALSWCPFQSNMLASGGGVGDNCIKFWNSHTGACLNTVDTGSQVSALLWSRHERELLSSHGLNDNQLILWKYPSLVKMKELYHHTSRVLCMAQSPDGYAVASAAADEHLSIWNVFGTPPEFVKPESNSRNQPFANVLNIR